jgi:CRP-like cAMP-binding protein
MGAVAEIDFRAFAESVGTVIDYTAGDPVFRENEVPRFMYIVLSGAVEISSHGKLLETIGEGKALGILSLLDGQTRTVTARASEDTRLAVIDGRRFRYMVEEMPHFCWYMMGELAHRLRATNAAL